MEVKSNQNSVALASAKPIGIAGDSGCSEECLMGVKQFLLGYF